MKKLNNKGYLLVEIVVAFSLAMAIMYLASDLTIKVKNKNDDLMIKTLTTTDQTIIYNMIMSAGAYKGCPTVNEITNKDNKKQKKLTYDSKIIILNEYVREVTCSSRTITINTKIGDNYTVVIPS